MEGIMMNKWDEIIAETQTFEGSIHWEYIIITGNSRDEMILKTFVSSRQYSIMLTRYSLEFTGGSLVPFFEWPFSAKSKLVETIVSTAVLAVTLKHNK